MREGKTRDEISQWINRCLQAEPGCADARATVKFELDTPDADGCNWSRDVNLNYGTCDEVLVRERLRPIWEAARRCFNVREI
jgi:hypothetical protein